MQRVAMLILLGILGALSAATTPGEMNISCKVVLVAQGDSYFIQLTVRSAHGKISAPQYFPCQGISWNVNDESSRRQIRFECDDRLIGASPSRGGGGEIPITARSRISQEVYDELSTAITKNAEIRVRFPFGYVRDDLGNPVLLHDAATSGIVEIGDDKWGQVLMIERATILDTNGSDRPPPPPK